jgi:hypothetical protein
MDCAPAKHGKCELRFKSTRREGGRGPSQVVTARPLFVIGLNRQAVAHWVPSAIYYVLSREDRREAIRPAWLNTILWIAAGVLVMLRDIFDRFPPPVRRFDVTYTARRRRRLIERNRRALNYLDAFCERGRMRERHCQPVEKWKGVTVILDGREHAGKMILH